MSDAMWERAALVLVTVLVSGCWSDFPAPLAPGAAPPGDQGPGSDGPPPDARPDGPLLPDGAPQIDVGVDAGPPPPERCNGSDDDGDGSTDEGFPLGMPCVEGQGECATEGETTCARDGMGIRCSAEAGRPTDEVCNGLDDDCSGVIDEGFEGVGMPCEVGNGVCRASGTRTCADDGSAVVCSVQPADVNRGLEQCNTRDDDCDGMTDENLVRSCAVEAVGVCSAGRQTCVEGQWTRCEGDVQPGDAQFDSCDGVDDDCDGITDEDVLPDGAAPCGAGLCDLAIDGCVPETPCVEQCDPDSELVPRCARAPELQCDGRDNDCDGVIDDDHVCGRPITETCTFTFGWSTEAIESPAATWGDCEPDGAGLGETYSCNRTRGVAFATLDLPAGVDLDAADDRIGVGFRCGEGAVGDYIVGACRIIVGVATADGGVADGAEAWGVCPEQRVGGDDQRACTSNSADGEFLPLPLPIDLDTDALLGVAFVCDDPQDPARAAALQRSIAVSLAWADSRMEIIDDEQWQAACAPLGDGEPYTGCATTRGDGRFRVFRLTADVDGGDRFAIRMAPIQ